MSTLSSAFIDAEPTNVANAHSLSPRRPTRPAFRSGSGWLHALSRALEQVPTAMVLTSERAEIVEVNGVARRLLREDDGMSSRGNQLMLTRAADQRQLRMLLSASRIAAEARDGRSQGLAVRRPSGAHPYYLTISAVTVDSMGQRPFVAKIDIIDLSDETRPDSRTLHELFELTPREVELAQALAEGCSLTEAGSRMGICHETVRSHLKQTFQKTRTCRQAQLVRLLLLCARAAPRAQPG